MQCEIPYFCMIDIWFRIPFPFLFPFPWFRFRFRIPDSEFPVLVLPLVLYWNTSRVLLLAVTSALYRLKVALIFSDIAKFLLCPTRKKSFKKNKTNRIYESGNDPHS